MSLRRACSILALTALAPTLLAAQDPQPAVVAGRVLVRADTAVPAPANGATVGIVGTSTVATTGADGRFLIAPAPTGARTLRIRAARVSHRPIARSACAAAIRCASRSCCERSVQLLSPVRTDARARRGRAVPVEAEHLDHRDRRAGDGRRAQDRRGRRRALRAAAARRRRAQRFQYRAHVRGGEADQNLVLLDGFPLYNPFHLGGLFSTFMDASVGGHRAAHRRVPRALRRPAVERARRAFGRGAAGPACTQRPTCPRSAPRRDSPEGSAAVAAAGASPDVAPTPTRCSPSSPTTSSLSLHRPPRPRRVRARQRRARGRHRVPGERRARRGPLLVRGRFDRVEVEPGPLGVRLGQRAARRRCREGRSASARRSSSGCPRSGFSTRLDLGSGASTQRSEVRDVRAAGSLRCRGDVHDRSIGYELTASASATRRARRRRRPPSSISRSDHSPPPCGSTISGSSRRDGSSRAACARKR